MILILQIAAGIVLGVLTLCGLAMVPEQYRQWERRRRWARIDREFP